MRKSIICFENMTLSFQNMTFDKKVNWKLIICFENMTLPFENKPPRFFGGYVCQHFAQEGRLPAVGSNSAQSWQTLILYPKYDNLYQKYINKIMFASFWGPQNVGKRPFLETYLFELFLHISFGLSGPLQTAFELKNSTAYSKKIRRMRLR